MMRQEVLRSIAGRAQMEEDKNHQRRFLGPADDSYAQDLLNRPVPAGYREEWTEILSKEKEDVWRGKRRSVVLFCLGKDWFALPTLLFSEISSVRPIHVLPQQRQAVLAGLVNIRGRLQPCINLHALLKMEESEQLRASECIYRRMAVLEALNQTWVFAVDEVHGVVRVEHELLENVPVTVERSMVSYLSQVFPWKGRRVGLLDEQLLFRSLVRTVR
jgi:chemotaxis signal transduction protein